MKVETVMQSAGSLFLAVSGAAANAMVGAAVIGDGRTALPLLLVAGVCGVVGGLFFQAEAGESAAFDFLTAIVAFITGMSAGPAIGQWAFDQIPGLDRSYVASFAPHMLGGLLSGACVVLFFRLIWANLRRLASVDFTGLKRIWDFFRGAGKGGGR